MVEPTSGFHSTRVPAAGRTATTADTRVGMASEGVARE
jgi:hypothetical protein